MKRVIISKQDITIKSQKSATIQKSTKRNERKSSLENIEEDPFDAPFKFDLNYDLYMQPKTDKIYEFQTKRFEFRRRPSHCKCQLLIIHFDGIVGDVVQKNLGDDNYQLVLRRDAIEGLKQLGKHFQLVLYTMMTERYCRHFVDLLDREDVVFDAVY